ncbi:recombinase family protein [Deinococcus radiomollis]
MSETFVTYSRVSTSDQNTNWSKPNQVAACHSFAESKNWKPYRECDFDDTQSGATDYIDRITLEKIVNLARSRVITRVIISRIDRIGRDRSVLESFVKDLYKENVIPVIASDGIEFPSADSFITKYIFEIAVAEYTRKIIIEGSIKGQKLAFESGAFLTVPPFGYKRVRSKGMSNGHKTSITTLLPDPISKELVIAGLEFFAESQSYRQAAIRLNFHNNNNPDLPKRSFISSSIVRMVENLDLYLGLPYKKSREFIKGETITRQFQHPAIIDQELAHRVRIADTLRNRETKLDAVPKPFRRLIFCSHCGRLAKISTKNPGNTQRANIYHYANCFSKEGNQNLIRNGMSHTLKSHTCSSEITIGKFIKCLERILSNLDNNLFESQMQELLAKKVFKLKNEGMKIDTVEYVLKRDTDELEKQKASLIKLINISSTINQTTLSIIEESISKLNQSIQDSRQSLMIRKESYLSQISELSNLGVTKEIIESIENSPLDAEDIEWMDSIGKDLLLSDPDLEKTTSKADILNRKHSRLFLAELMPHVMKATELIDTLRTALKSKDWILLNETMAQLGLRFTADFSESDRVKRTQSIRLEMHGQTFRPYDGRVSGDCASGSCAGRAGCPVGIH